MWYLVIALIFIVLMLAAYRLHRVTMFPKVNSYERIQEKDVESGVLDLDEFNSYPVEDVEITSKEGLKLVGQFFDFGFDDTVIIVHGYTVNQIGARKYMKMFIEKGYNILTFDHRNHGKSEGVMTSFGYHEKHDLYKWVDFVKSRKTGLVGTHGESMGAATVIQHAAIDDRVDFVVADCPFKDVRTEFAARVWEDHKIPPYLILRIASLINRLSGNGWYSSISPIKVINDFEAPIFLIHGLADTYILPKHSKELYEKRVENKKLYLVPEAKHALSYLVNKEEYTKQVQTFIKEYVKRES